MTLPHTFFVQLGPIQIARLSGSWGALADGGSAEGGASRLGRRERGQEERHAERDQGLAAPNLTAIAEDFGFEPAQRDRYLGGVVRPGFLWPFFLTG